MKQHNRFIYISSFFLLWVCLLYPVAVKAQFQTIEIPSSWNPVGSGARALGMGGAFIAVADDATAASWNPGGLMQLERPEISVVGATFRRREGSDLGLYPDAAGAQSVSEMDLNYLSVSYPFNLFGRNMIVSLNYQHLFDFTRELDFSLFLDTGAFQHYRGLDIQQEGSLSAIGLAYCIQVTPRFSFGFTLNFWEDWLNDNQWSETVNQKDSMYFSGSLVTSDEANRFSQYSLSGFNVNLGLLWNATARLVVGAVLKTPFTADIKYEFKTSGIIGASDLSENQDLDMPMSYGIGVSYRFSDELTVSGDIYRTEWGDFVLKKEDGSKISPLSNLSSNESDIDATHQVRIGGEYLFIKPKYVIPLRFGIFYDPAPAEGDSDNFYGVTIGPGIAMGPYIFDLAYQYRFGRDVGGSAHPELDFSQDVDEHTVYASLIIHF